MPDWTTKSDIIPRARAEGFDVVRVTDAAAQAHAKDGLAAYLAHGHHGEMEWMETRTAERADPQTLWRDARSVIVLGMNYGPDRDPLDVLAQKDRAAIS